MKVNSPQRKVDLFPLKSLLYHNSSELRRNVPVSTGANEPGECVSTPATFMFLDKYFLALGKILHPVLKKQTQTRASKPIDLFADREEAFIMKFKWVNIEESIHNVSVKG